MEADAAPSLDARAALTSGRDMWSTAACEPLGIQSVRMSDGPMGIAGGRVDERDIALLTPSPTALGASWDPDLVFKVGGLVAVEARQRGVDLVLAPNVNLARSPLTGRLFEMFSEDPYLTGALGGAWISGLQAGGVGAAVKHFVANDSETDRHAMNSVVDEATLRQVYLQPFEHAVRAGAWTLMTAYNRINGEWCSGARRLLTDVVKGEWDFDGVVLSDWFGTHDTIADAEGGLDLEMPGPARRFGPAIAQAVREGDLSAERLDDAVARVARLAGRVANRPAAPTMTSEDRLALLERATIEGFVLLRNEGLLPLAPGSGRIAVIGPNALTPCLQGGSFARIAVDPDRPDPVAAISARFGTYTVTAARGLASDSRLPPLHRCDIRTADGEKGVLLEILNEGGDVVFSEVRDTSLLIWFAEMPGLGRLDQSGGLRIRTRFTAHKSGTHRFLFGGTGVTRFLIDGIEVGSHDPQVAPADIMGALMRGDSAAFSRDLQTGDAVDLEYVMRFEPARAQGVWFGCAEPEPAEMTAEAIALAREADAVVLIVGESQDAALESVDRTTTHLAPAQVALIESVCAANPRTLVVVNAARPVAMDWAALPAAILQVWFPGQEFGPALAKVLAGDEEPGGRLPLTFAAAEADYPVFDLTPDAAGDLNYNEGDAIGYRGLLVAGKASRYPFGFGLGYADIVLTKADVAGDAVEPTFSAMVENRSARSGKVVVQLYMEPVDQDGAFLAPRLVAFSAARIAPGSVETLTLSPDTLARRVWDVSQACWQAPRDGCRYTLGLSSEDRRFQFTVGDDQTARISVIG